MSEIVNQVKSFLIEKADDIGDWLRSPGAVKSPLMAVGGLSVSWAIAKSVLSGVVLVGTAILISMHVYNAIIRQWCPLRRKKWGDCTKCPLKGTVWCWRGTNPDVREDLG